MGNPHLTHVLIFLLTLFVSLHVSLPCSTCPPEAPHPPPPKKAPPPKAPCPPPPKKAPPPKSPCPPPPKEADDTCHGLKLDACVDLLGGLIHIGIGSDAKQTCCPVIAGLVDLDAALCLCSTIKAKLLDISVVLPIALQLLLDCGKTPPAGFQCHA